MSCASASAWTPRFNDVVAIRPDWQGRSEPDRYAVRAGRPCCSGQLAQQEVAGPEQSMQERARPVTEGQCVMVRTGQKRGSEHVGGRLQCIQDHEGVVG
jgi:hypothetical protein